MKELSEEEKIELETRKVISDNLKRLMKENGNMSQRELSRIANVSESTVGKWLLLKATPRMGAIQKIADHFGVLKSDITEKKIDEPENIYPVASESIHIPILGEIACGDPIYAEENFAGYRVEPKDAVPSGNSYYLQAKGDSMEPTIPDGAYVLIREQPDVENGEIAAVLLSTDNEATLKRVSKQNDTIILVPDNPKHSPTVVTADNPVKIIGKAIRFTVDL